MVAPELRGTEHLFHLAPPPHDTEFLQLFFNVFNTYFNNYLLRMYDVNGDSIHLT